MINTQDIVAMFFKIIKMFAWFIILVAAASAGSFLLKENYNAMLSSFYGVAIGSMLLLLLDNRTKQLAIIKGLTDVFKAFEDDIDLRSSKNNPLNDVVVQTFTADNPEDAQAIMDSLHGMFDHIKIPNEFDDQEITHSQLLDKLKKHIDNEEYEEAEKVRLEIAKKKPPKS